MKFFRRVDKIVSTLASLSVPISEGDVNRKLVKVLTAHYEIEQRTLCTAIKSVEQRLRTLYGKDS